MILFELITHSRVFEFNVTKQLFKLSIPKSYGNKSSRNEFLDLISIGYLRVCLIVYYVNFPVIYESALIAN